MICNEYKEEEHIYGIDINTLWDDKLYHGFPICSGCVPLIKHLYGWNYWDRHKYEIKKDYYDGIMRELHPEKTNLDR